MTSRPPRKAPRFRRIAVAALVLASEQRAALAVAAEPTLEPPPPSVVTTRSRGLRVWIDAEHSGLDQERIRAAIARELSSDVELAETSDTPLRIAETSDQRVQVLYRNEAGEELSRVVDLPQNPDRQVEVIALMVGNLTRNEAAELLAALQPKPETKPPPPPVAPPPKAPPKPARSEQELELGSGYLFAERPGANASLYYPIGLLRDSDRRVLAIEAALGYGRAGAIQGVGIAIGALRVEHQVQGLALAVGATRVDGPLRGVQLGVLYNEGHASQVGVNVSAGVIYQRAKVTGISAAGLVNISKDVEGLGVGGALEIGRNLRGIHIAGLASLATGQVEGVQIAGLLQVSAEMRGIAVAGALNHARATRGLAISGVVNSTGDLDGVAFSLINVGGRVRGVQLGLVNVATKDLRGFQLGLVNYARDNGHIQLQAFADTLVPANAGLKFTTGYGYSEVGFGVSGSTTGGQGYLGLGLHFPLDRFSFDLGGRISASTQQDSNNGGPKRTDMHYLGQVGVRVVRGIELFGGGGVRHGVLGSGAEDVEPEVLGGLAFF